MYKALKLFASELEGLPEHERSWIERYDDCCMKGDFDSAIQHVGKRVESALSNSITAHRPPVDIGAAEKSGKGSGMGGAKPSTSSAGVSSVQGVHQLMSQFIRLHPENRWARRFQTFITESRNAAAHPRRPSERTRTVEPHLVLVAALSFLRSPGIADVDDSTRAVFETAIQRLIPYPIEGPDGDVRLKNVSEAMGSVVAMVREQLVGSSREAPVRLSILALDMNSTWRLLVVDILKKIGEGALDLDVLMIDPAAPELEAVTVKDNDYGHVSRLAAERLIHDITQFFEASPPKTKLDVRMKLYLYSHLPVIHGAIINDSELFLSFCRLDADGKLVGGDEIYQHHSRNKGKTLSAFNFEIFNSWFRRWRNQSRCVVDYEWR